jgi:hypothetical protein
MIYEKTDKPGYYRDMTSGAVINRDAKALELYRLKKMKKAQMEERQNKIESEVAEIKEMLQSVINKLTEH